MRNHATLSHRGLQGIAQRLVLALLAALAGCAPVGPDYRDPGTTVRDSFANARQSDLSGKKIDVLWWRGFHDPQLTRLIELAMARNLDLRIATTNLQQARALRFLANLDLYPIVTSNVSHTNILRSTAQFGGNSAIKRDVDYFNAGFDATWELDFFGRIRRSIEARSAEVDAADANRRDVIVSLAAELARNYVELRGTQNRLAVARKNAANQDASLKLTQVRLESGRGTRLDTARASEQLYTTLATIPPLEAEILRTIYRISVLTAQQPDTLVKVLEPPKPIPDAPKIVMIGKPAELLRRRPDIRIVERNLAAATARIGVSVADLFPRVRFNGSFAFQAQDFTRLVGSGGTGAYQFGPSIQWAAFDLLRVQGNIAAAEADADAQLADYQRTVLRALEETENALVEFGRQQARREYLRQAATDSETAARLARLRYENGVADFLAVLDAERRLLESQDRLAETETNTATALVAVYKALGGGWESATPPEPLDLPDIPGG
jgi:multidrug efflux system outer membrane protein